jgi:hypothetical protein
LSPDQVSAVLASHNESFSAEQLSYYPSLETLAATVRGSRSWAEGEIFVWAPSATVYVILKQVAPSSCELMTITPTGYQDVLTGWKFETADLVAQLRAYLDSQAG